MLNRLCNLQSDCGQSGAADGVREITGATPAYVAVSRHAAFSSLLSSLRGSPRFAYTSYTCFTYRNSERISYMNIKPQPKIEMTTLTVHGVDKRLADGFKQRCDELNGSAHGFIMNQVLEEFLRSTEPKRKASGT